VKTKDDMQTAGTSLEQRQEARLLGGISLAWSILAGLSVVVCLTAAPQPQGAAVAKPLVFTAIGHLVAYAISRRWVRAAMALEIVTHVATAVCVRLAMGDADANAELSMAWSLGLGLLSAAAFLRPRAIAVTGLALTATFFVTMLALGRGGPEPKHAMTLFLCEAVLLIVVMRHRDRLEAIHHAELRARNEELEALRGSLEERVEARTRELQEANETLRRNQNALLSSEKMAAIGRLTAGIAHEMGSPLAAVMCALDDLTKLNAEYAESIGDRAVTAEDHRAISEEMAQAMSLASTGAERAAAYVRSIRAQTRDDGTRSSSRFDVAALTRDSLALVAHAARAAHCNVALEAPDACILLHGPASRLGQVITNLVHNAVDAQGERGGGDVRVAVRDEGDAVVIAVADEGPGMAPEVAAHIFEPLFTTKPYGKGTGLGLAIAKEAVEGDFSGTIEVDTHPGKGTCMIVRLPRAQSRAADRAA
jgi:signal transduction histidine kinase